MRYLLSIHDVWPGNVPVVEDHWQKLRSLGMGPAALLVVPEYHGKTSIAQAKDFLSWLAEKRAAGSEILLHGFRHLMAERVDGARLSSRRSAWGRWVNSRWVGSEAEFLGLARPDREALFEAGARSFAQAGLPFLGFVAPTWHGAPPRAALLARGFRLWETRFRLHSLAERRSRWVPALAWDPSPSGPALFGGEAWLKIVARLPLIKVAIHPGDLDGKHVAGQLEKVAAMGRPRAYTQAFEP
jgi:predicted deacetylase